MNVGNLFLILVGGFVVLYVVSVVWFNFGL